MRSGPLPQIIRVDSVFQQYRVALIRFVPLMLVSCRDTQSVEVTVNDVTRVDVLLLPGQVTESVTVSASAVALQTDRAKVRGQISTRRLTNLPVPGQRNY